ncbi:hypothetical protein [Bdellovibrio bacteriovorus]|uniref:Uncharacterized protein n=1 Tax=Bdellovibrio bacteriovorus str. Tiberius TaxID=1069642 RepID=K7Z0C0_BDEBC|nr:hypothetical protein [Bdellovibrio bacteriovorus]AFY02440.1 hypothetical protein Bdt_2759 [Bdellovibrio bacteriovorus str. Tiberius]
MNLKAFVLMPLAILTICGSQALALTDWQEVGNGGQVLVCENSTIAPEPGRYVTMYDYAEAKFRYRLTPKMPKAILTFPMNPNIAPENLIAMEILKRLPHEGYTWYGKAVGLVQNFYAEANLIAGVDLVIIRDTGMGFIPRGCKLEQLIAQSRPTVPEDRYYKINSDLWDWMFPEQRATAILHEVLYRLSPKAKFIFSSEKIRYVVGLLISDTFRSKSPEEQNALLLEAGLLY